MICRSKRPQFDVDDGLDDGFEFFDSFAFFGLAGLSDLESMVSRV